MSKKSRKVRCATDDLIFNSVSEAAKYYNVPYANIYGSIRRFCKCGDKYFHWDLGEEFAKKFDMRIADLEYRKSLREEIRR